MKGWTLENVWRKSIEATTQSHQLAALSQVVEQLGDVSGRGLGQQLPRPVGPDKVGQRIGYVRASSVEQNRDRQLQGQELARTFTDKASGKDAQGPELEQLKFVREGDRVVVHSMDRLGTTSGALVADLTKRGVKIQFVKKSLTFTGEDSRMSNLLLSVMGAFAEFERGRLLRTAVI